MTVVRRSALVDRSAGHLFDLIEAAEHYPEFLPWCKAARITRRDGDVFFADLVALRWMSLWQALASPSATRAVVSSILRIMVLPWTLFLGLAVLGAVAGFRIDVHHAPELAVALGASSLMFAVTLV